MVQGGGSANREGGRAKTGQLGTGELPSERACGQQGGGSQGAAYRLNRPLGNAAPNFGPPHYLLRRRQGLYLSVKHTTDSSELMGTEHMHNTLILQHTHLTMHILQHTHPTLHNSIPALLTTEEVERLFSGRAFALTSRRRPFDSSRILGLHQRSPSAA